jgi:succinyl-diaminopimelate desuccinylase
VSERFDDTFATGWLTRLVQAASPSGRESPAAEVCRAMFVAAGADSVEVDQAGNVIATYRRGEGRTLHLNGHLDTVPVGDAERWPVPPLSGQVVDGALWGRGAVDMKGALAAMALAAARASQAGFQGTLVISAVVQEEVGGLGARFLAAQQRADLVVLGEPSNLKLMLGHRGRVEVRVSLPGAIAHAAKASLGDNALSHAARYMLALEKLALPTHPVLGGSSATVTQCRSFPEGGANVVPGRADLTIDYRSVPGDEPDAIVARLQALDARARVTIESEEAASEDASVRMRFTRVNPAYGVDPQHPVVAWAQATLAGALGGVPEVGHWWFATDAPHLAAMGAPVIGFGPGDPEVAHTHREALPLAHLHAAARGYEALIRAGLRPGPAWTEGVDA